MSVTEKWHNDCISFRDHGIWRLYLHSWYMKLLTVNEISLAKLLNGKPLVDSTL